MQIRPYDPKIDEPCVVDLWLACGLVVPHNDPQKDISRKLRVNPEWFLVGEVEGSIIATCMAGYEGHRGWINYLAVHPDHQTQGHAAALMNEAETLLRAAGCPKINLMVRLSNLRAIEFYERLGFQKDEVVCLSKRLELD